jgi:hypothetical protein
MTLLIMKFLPAVYYFTPVRSKYSPQHTVLKQSIYSLSLMLHTTCHVHTKL